LTATLNQTGQEECRAHLGSNAPRHRDQTCNNLSSMNAPNGTTKVILGHAVRERLGAGDNIRMVPQRGDRRARKHTYRRIRKLL